MISPFEAERLALALALALALGACDDEPRKAAPTATVTAPPPAPPPPAPPPPREVVEWSCPPEMVLVTPSARSGTGGAGGGSDGAGVGGGSAPTFPYCVDRYEAMLVDHATKARISPYYSPSKKWSTYAHDLWSSKRFEVGGPKAKAMPLPVLPAWQRAREFEPEVTVRAGVTPNGHTSGAQAEVACRNADKRLCAWREWRHACGGEKGWAFPYGPTYVQGRCNVFREGHPAAELHDDASRGHTDPRLNKVAIRGRPLLRKTGETRSCASTWGDDAIYDMVGNLDEWTADPDGEFAGGFYARASKDGCDWRARGHSYHYADYSTGVRCCRDATKTVKLVPAEETSK